MFEQITYTIWRFLSFFLFFFLFSSYASFSVLRCIVYALARLNPISCLAKPESTDATCGDSSCFTIRSYNYKYIFTHLHFLPFKYILIFSAILTHTATSRVIELSDRWEIRFMLNFSPLLFPPFTTYVSYRFLDIHKDGQWLVMVRIYRL